MTEKQFKKLLKTHDVLYFYDDVLKLYLIFIDDMTIYFSPENLKEMQEEDMNVFMVKQLVTQLLSKGKQKDVIIH